MDAESLRSEKREGANRAAAATGVAAGQVLARGVAPRVVQAARPAQRGWEAACGLGPRGAAAVAGAAGAGRPVERRPLP